MGPDVQIWEKHEAGRWLIPIDHALAFSPYDIFDGFTRADGQPTPGHPRQNSGIIAKGLDRTPRVAHADNAATTYDREAEGEDHHLARPRGLERSRTESQ